jgi:hypothetical protein
MPTESSIAGRSLVIAVTGWLGALAFASCQAPEAFYPDDGGAITGVAGRPVTGAAGTTGPGPTGAAGRTDSGRGGATGVAGSPGRGGATVVGNPGRGGTTGGLGRGGTTGTVDAGVPGRGGATGGLGRGGTTGTVDAGVPGRGGATGGLGRGGAAGASRDGGVDAGTVRDAGNPANARTDGAAGTGPCAGLCDMPRVVPGGAASGDLGTAATCDEVTGNLTHIVCGNLVAPRTLKVNNVTVSCAGSGVMLPAARNGGYCVQATAGQYSYAYFETY